MKKELFKKGDTVRCTHPDYDYSVRVTRNQEYLSYFPGVIIRHFNPAKVGDSSDSYQAEWFELEPVNPFDHLIESLKKLEEACSTKETS